MFGKNEIVGKSYFKNQKPNELTVTSRFFTLQGEGPFRGKPAYFIRLTKCNLACSFCDTFFDSGDVKTFDELLSEVPKVIEEWFAGRNLTTPNWAKTFYGKSIPEVGTNLHFGRTEDLGEDYPYGIPDHELVSDPRDVVLVISGGEPTIQPGLIDFIHRAKKHFKYVQIESNGIQFAGHGPFTYVVSPKCLEKDGKPVKYLKPNDEVLENASCLKFVISAPESDKFNVYSEVPAWAYEWKRKFPNREVYVSPMNIYNTEPQKSKQLRQEKNDIDIVERSTVDEVISFWEPGLLNMQSNQRNHEYAAEYALKHGFILNLQIHLFASMA